MAVTITKSTEITAATVTLPLVAAEPHVSGGKMRVLMGRVVQGVAAGDANSTLEMVILPPGRWRIMLALSRFKISALGAARVLSAGYRAYVNEDGVDVAVNLSAFRTALDVSAAVAFTLDGVVGADETFTVSSRDGVTLVFQVTGGTIPAAAVCDGYVVAVQN